MVEEIYNGKQEVAKRDEQVVEEIYTCKQAAVAAEICNDIKVVVEKNNSSEFEPQEAKQEKSELRELKQGRPLWPP